MLKRLRHWAQKLRPSKITVAHGHVFALYRGDVLLGKIVLRAELCDYPWYGGEFQAEPAFAPFEPLFREELRLLGEEEMDAWGEVWGQIDDPALTLVSAGSEAPAESNLQIHIQDGVAWWRA
jgi:hypothetical protein